MYFLKGRAKIELGIGKGKKKYDKREDLKKKSARARNGYMSESTRGDRCHLSLEKQSPTSF